MKRRMRSPRPGRVLVSDYGRGVTADRKIRAALAKQAERVPLVWDPHPRGAAPVPHARLVTPNHAEAAALAGLTGPPALTPAAAAAHYLGQQWSADAVAITLGEQGAVLVQGGDRAAGGPGPRGWPSPTRAGPGTGSRPRPRWRSGPGP